MRTKTILFSLLGLVAGCSTDSNWADPQDPLAHRVPVPKEYAWGKANPHFLSSLERYTYAYDQAWWACIEKFSKNINYQPTMDDRMGNGWPSAIAGTWDGYVAAEVRVHEMINRFGKQRTGEILKGSFDFPE